LDMYIISSPVKLGITSNICIKIFETNIYRVPNTDLVYFMINSIPPKKDLSKFFFRDAVNIRVNGWYLKRDADGLISKNYVRNVASQFIHTKELGIGVRGWLGTAEAVTIQGDCGTTLVLDTPNGPVIAGIHFLGKERSVAAHSILQKDNEAATQHFRAVHILPGPPLLKSQTAERILSASLHPKAVCRWIPEGVANVYGTIVGSRGKPRSKVQPTLMCPFLLSKGYKIEHGKPVMDGWLPWNIALSDMVKPSTNFDSSIIDSCVESFTQDILSAIPKEALKFVHVYDDFTALNGAAGVRYVDKIKRNTSAGSPWNTCKKKFLEPYLDDPELPEARVVTKEIQDRVDLIEELYKQRKRYMPVFSAHLKDEATPKKKIESGKTRVFTGAPFDWSLVVRKYLLSVIKLIQSNPYIFEAAPGINSQSLQWQVMYNYLKHFGKDRMVAGDYKAFDKSMPASIILASFQIIINIVKEAGYSEEELLVVRGIAEDTAFPLVDFNGELIEFYGSNPSGHPLTVIINCLANCLYLRYVYTKLSPLGNCVDFKQKVNLMTYGDDNVMGVSTEAPWFNHTTIQHELAKLGIVYTMPDKEAVSVPFVSINEVTFLKRGWRLDTDIGAVVAPLEMDSINRSLTMCVKSKALCDEAQCVEALVSALQEYFFHGKEKFLEFRKLVFEIIDELDLYTYITDSTFLKYDEFYERFWGSSESFKWVTTSEYWLAS